jgi:hypothetical protein
MMLRRVLKRRAVFLTLGMLLALALPSCKSNTAPSTPQEYVHELGVYASYLFTGVQATGTYTVTLSSGQSYEAGLGERVTLAKTTKQTELCTITIRGNGALPREYTGMAVTNTDLTTTLAETAKLDVGNLLKYVLFGGKNPSWTPKTIKVIFNPDPNGVRLSKPYTDEITRAVNNIKTWSGGYITDVTFDYEGNKVQNASTPPEGEIWAFKETIFSGVSNGTYPTNGAKVTSGKIFINEGHGADPLMTYNETFDAFIYGEQNFLGGWFDSRPEWVTFIFNRPRDTNSYVFSAEKETQSGIDSQTEVQSHGQVSDSPKPLNFIGELMGGGENRAGRVLSENGRRMIGAEKNR